MVRLQVKKGDETQFLYETELCKPIEKLALELVAIYNGRLKISRICAEIEELMKHGTMYPPEMLGLTEEQVEELKLVDTWGEKCIPSGGFVFNKDPIGRRNGKQPKLNMQEVLKKAVEEVKEMVSKKIVCADKCLTLKIVQNGLDILKGAVTIVYPMQLPPHDPIRMEFSNIEDLAGTQASLEVIEPAKCEIWFAGHQMLPDKLVSDYAGRNDKCKLIVKICKRGQGCPGREPALNDEQRKQLMVHAYRRQEELKKLEQDDDDQYLNASWADSGSLKRQVHGLENVRFRIGK